MFVFSLLYMLNSFWIPGTGKVVDNDLWVHCVRYSIYLPLCSLTLFLKIHVWEYLSTDNQKWYLEPVMYVYSHY